MPVLTDYLSRRGEILVLIAVVVVSVGIMLLSTGDRDTMARVLGEAALTPVQATIDRSLHITGLRAENDSLRAQLARATVALGELRERDVESARLREMLDFRESSDWTLLAARVVAREAGRPGDGYKINRGSADGVRKNLGVMTARGLVGRISRVTEDAAWVRPIVARECQVSARVDRTRTVGILDWSSRWGLHLTFVPFRAGVSAGDTVTSTGLGGVFPGGIRIGEVTRTEPVPSQGTLRVFVTPAVNFSSLEDVFVVLNATDSPASGETVPGPPPLGG